MDEDLLSRTPDGTYWRSGGTVPVARLHMSGFFWGDCSLSNTLFRYDAGDARGLPGRRGDQRAAPELSAGQRKFDVELAVERVYGELLDLEAGRPAPGRDSIRWTVAEELERQLRGAVGRAHP